MLSQYAGRSDSATVGEKDQWNVSVLTVSMRTAISNLLRTFILLIVVTLIAVYREELSLTVYHQDLVTQSSSDLRIGPADKVLGTSNMLRKSLILTSSSLNSSGGSVVALLPMSGQGLNSQTTDLDEHPRWRPTNCTAYYLRANKSDRGKLKTIRFLHQWNNSPDHVVSDLARRFEQISMNTCGYHCKIEKGKTHKGADLAVFIGLGLKLDTKLPPVKGPRELWALHSEEAQFVNTPDPTAWDGLFNYSTVWIRETGLHGERWRLHYHKLSSPKTRNFAAERRAKFGPALANALWFVSNCIYDSFWAPSSGRVSYALELGKNIEVNAFSRKKAGSYFCTGPLASIQKTAKQNEQPAFDEYLFYLSFENSLCRDYITEKFWKILQADTYTIPIVLGGSSIEDYSRVAPPNSFIHVKNFTSPKHLAKHLKYIANNDDAYNYYHQWRNEYTLEKVNVLERRLCLYCMLAHERPPDVWYTFSQDFTTKDCINVLEPEKTCEYYNLNLTEKYCHSQRRNVTQSKTRK